MGEQVQVQSDDRSDDGEGGALVRRQEEPGAAGQGVPVFQGSGAKEEKRKQKHEPHLELYPRDDRTNTTSKSCGKTTQHLAPGPSKTIRMSPETLKGSDMRASAPMSEEPLPRANVTHSDVASVSRGQTHRHERNVVAIIVGGENIDMKTDRLEDDDNIPVAAEALAPSPVQLTKTVRGEEMRPGITTLPSSPVLRDSSAGDVLPMRKKDNDALAVQVVQKRKGDAPTKRAKRAAPTVITSVQANPTAAKKSECRSQPRRAPPTDIMTDTAHCGKSSDWRSPTRKREINRKKRLIPPPAPSHEVRSAAVRVLRRVTIDHARARASLRMLHTFLDEAEVRSAVLTDDLRAATLALRHQETAGHHDAIKSTDERIKVTEALLGDAALKKDLFVKRSGDVEAHALRQRQERLQCDLDTLRVTEKQLRREAAQTLFILQKALSSKKLEVEEHNRKLRHALLTKPQVEAEQRWLDQELSAARHQAEQAGVDLVAFDETLEDLKLAAEAHVNDSDDEQDTDDRGVVGISLRGAASKKLLLTLKNNGRSNPSTMVASAKECSIMGEDKKVSARKDCATSVGREAIMDGSDGCIALKQTRNDNGKKRKQRARQVADHQLRVAKDGKRTNSRKSTKKTKPKQGRKGSWSSLRVPALHEIHTPLLDKLRKEAASLKLQQEGARKDAEALAILPPVAPKSDASSKDLVLTEGALSAKAKPVVLKNTSKSAQQKESRTVVAEEPPDLGHIEVPKSNVNRCAMEKRMHSAASAPWFFVNGLGKQCGPIAFEKLCALVSRGVIRGSTLVWNHILVSGWVSYSQALSMVDDALPDCTDSRSRIAQRKVTSRHKVLTLPIPDFTASSSSPSQGESGDDDQSPSSAAASVAKRRQQHRRKLQFEYTGFKASMAVLNALGVSADEVTEERHRQRVHRKKVMSLQADVDKLVNILWAKEHEVSEDRKMMHNKMPLIHSQEERVRTTLDIAKLRQSIAVGKQLLSEVEGEECRRQLGFLTRHVIHEPPPRDCVLDSCDC